MALVRELVSVRERALVLVSACVRSGPCREHSPPQP